MKSFYVEVKIGRGEWLRIACFSGLPEAVSFGSRILPWVKTRVVDDEITVWQSEECAG
jgi:hypothetical protein